MLGQKQYREGTFIRYPAIVLVEQVDCFPTIAGK